MLQKFGVQLARYVYEASLQYLQAYNPHSARAIPSDSVAPIFLLHTGASLKGGGVDHIKPWLPLFERCGVEYLVVVRMMDVYEQMRLEYPHVPVSLVKSSADVDSLLDAFPSLTGFFYVANTANNNLLLRCAGGRHVFLGHGDSDKSSSMNRTFKIYDEIYVAGQGHIDRFANADFDATGLRFRIIGRPDSRELLAQGVDAARAAKRIVYIPTWEGYCAEQNYSSFPIAKEVLRAAYQVSGLPVLGKLHPLTGADKPEYLDIDRRIIEELALGPEQLRFVDRHGKLTDILEPDAIYICDVSAAVSECLALDQPIFVYVPERNVRVVSGKMTYADFAYTYNSAEEFARKLEGVLGGDDYLALARKQAREYFISPDASLSGAFEEGLSSIAACAWLSQEAPERMTEVDVQKWPVPGTCRSCGSDALDTETIACSVPKLRGKSFRFETCRSCGFVSNPDNQHDYAEVGFSEGSRPEIGTRAGDGVQPRREYKMAEMAADILAYRSPELRSKLLVFGAGLSRDHQLISTQLPFARVALSDVDNFQSTQDFVPLGLREQEFDVVIASEVLEHFTNLETDFTNLFSKVNDSGLVVASTNIHDGSPLHRLVYPFSPGHVSYHSGRSLYAVAKRFGMKLDFRVPAIAMGSGGPRKRYVFFYRDPVLGECISQYFADHCLAPSE
ncbi:methyltransferase domain-containing protein [Stutzerimonas nitrititolerans]|uniref:methyltransferase domain-containing protein n=1 Tax=Stutzerimonas nitrititolerans TaxID=2482751 RepID=UPI0028AC08E9|nr:methyltransferase domain-containing protein [Stutzerimonas nitrititolerans]